MAGIIHFPTQDTAPAFERELTLEGASVRVSRSGDTVTLAIERETGAGTACIAATLTRSQVSALVKMLIEAAS